MGYPQKLGRPQRGKGLEPFNRTAHMALKEREVAVCDWKLARSNFSAVSGAWAGRREDFLQEVFFDIAANATSSAFTTELGNRPCVYNAPRIQIF